MNTQIDNYVLPDDEEIALASEVLKLASDPTRLKILLSLLHGEHSVGGLAKHIDAQPPAVSQHLSKLRLAQLVKVRRDGTTIFYSTDNEHVHNLINEALSHARQKNREV